MRSPSLLPLPPEFFFFFLLLSRTVDHPPFMPWGSLRRVDKESETAADVSNGRVDAKQARLYVCSSGYYLRSCAEILPRGPRRSAGEIFN